MVINLSNLKSYGSVSSARISPNLRFGGKKQHWEKSIEAFQLRQQQDLKKISGKSPKVLLFYSGGLDTSFLLHFFAQTLGVEVYTVSFDLGGQTKDQHQLATRAKALGSKQHIVIEAQKQFAQAFCLPAIMANARYLGEHPLCSSLSRPLMAEQGVLLAQQLGCNWIMHGSTPTQNNHARFNHAILAISRREGVRVRPLAPLYKTPLSREAEYAYLQSHDIEIDLKEDNLLSSDDNLWGREIEDGQLREIAQKPKANIYKLTADPLLAPEDPETLEIAFQRGKPISLNGQKMPLLALIKALNTMGGRHGVGRHDTLEHKAQKVFKEREIHEAPAATILIDAHRELENTVTPTAILWKKRHTDLKWVRMVCEGKWFHHVRENFQRFMQEVNCRVTGVVKLELYKGSARVVGRSSPYSLDIQRIEKRQS